MASLVKGAVASFKPNFATFLKFAKVELTPPSPGDIPAISRGIGELMSAAKSGKWKHLTVKEAWLNVLVFTEVTCWFWVGECIGKRNIIGYKVEV
ncbi:ATP synthase subunit g, mitochondrial-like [Macrosteles quadrilineatus]|uniref:ATP synthase subunit g, mitochondrial-like n=1 Tax=Macrosteles quadrilineatus TaxID=74068 RepID=UPI0023E2F3F5|nr:ATP synthase subunit g, mitochondrial-like [Macrosteles quadrilineatus]XP_054263091.1 ATP synthase subunit g, mitochondrial-like [Macrosteles quadrilineatus]